MGTFLALLFMFDPPKPKPPAKAPIVVRDARGRATGTFTPSGSSFVIRDARGIVQGSVTLRGTGAVVRDSRGRISNNGK